MIEHFIDLPNVSLLYLLAVLVSAVYAGYLAAMLAAVLSALAYNFFFIPPVNTFTIASPHEVFGLIVFVIAALICRRAGVAAERAGGDGEASRGLDPGALRFLAQAVGHGQGRRRHLGGRDADAGFAQARHRASFCRRTANLRSRPPGRPTPSSTSPT